MIVIGYKIFTTLIGFLKIIILTHELFLLASTKFPINGTEIKITAKISVEYLHQKNIHLQR